MTRPIAPKPLQLSLLASALFMALNPAFAQQDKAADGEKAKELENVVVVGSRSAAKAALDTPAPVGLVSNRDLQNAGPLEVGKLLQTPTRAAQPAGDVLLSLTGLRAKAPNTFGMALKDISLELRAGEILGIGGVAGNGQDELLEALSGERPAGRGMVVLKGEDIGPLSPTARRARGLLTAPEERMGHAAAPDMSLTENAMLTGALRQGLDKGGFLNWPAARQFAEDVIKQFDVRTPGPHAAARSLSGGNLQKFVIGREVMQRPEVFVVNQPTWGVDASAAAAIRQALLDLAQNGAALIVISQDLDELMEISDRFAALNEGRLSDPRPAQGITVEEIGLMMGGAHGMEVAHV